jgi:DegV family protein with EDD domain
LELIVLVKIAWVTDSTAYLSPTLKNNPDVYVLNTTLHFNDKVYKDEELTTEELYDMLSKEKTVPKTSQPPIGEFLEVYEKIQEEYDLAIAIHVSSKLSGTYSTSEQASKMVDFPITVIDSKVLSYPLTDMLYAAINAHEQGKSVEEIIETINNKVDAYETYVLIGSLDQLHKSGRMNTAQYFLGNLLSVKPIIQLADGKIEVVDKVRTEKKAIKKVYDKLTAANNGKDLDKLFILHCNALDKANEIKKEMHQLYPSLHVDISPLSSTVGVHTGEGTIAISWI